jgi:thioredoxin-related protein
MNPRVFLVIFAAAALTLSGGCIGSQGGAGVTHLPTDVKPPVADFKNPKSTSLSGIEWTKSFDEGMKLAKEKNKPALLYFWAVWCSFCAKMDKEVFSDSEVSGLLRDGFIPVLLDVDKEANYPYLKDYKVVGTPTFVIVTAKGELLRGGVGYKTKEEFLRFLRTG